MTVDEDRSTPRLQRLRAGVTRVRVRGGMDRDRAHLIVGAVLMVGGLLAIGIGWYGTSQTGLLFEQIPYVVSGGLLGVALAFLGGFVYFSYWVTKLLNETREQSRRAAELLEQISGLLGDGASGTNGSAAPPRFVATSSGTQFHRVDCPSVVGKSGLRTVTPRTRGLEPCKICDPLG